MGNCWMQVIVRQFSGIGSFGLLETELYHRGTTYKVILSRFQRP